MVKKKTTKKKGFLDGYETYEGEPGNPNQWKAVFEHRMGLDEAKRTLDKDDPFVVLGLSGRPTTNQIKKAYRIKALECHPDRYQGRVEKLKAHSRFLKVQAAYTLALSKMALRS